MRLDTLNANGFRTLDGLIHFPSSMTLLVGENNSGKSAVIDALRILTPPRAGNQFGRWITADDFRHDSNGRREVDALELTGTFVDLNDAELARMVTCLAPSVGERAAKLRVVAQIDSAERVKVAWFGGDSMQVGIEPWAREAAQHTYLPPLRDATADLRPGRDNKLVKLLNVLAPKDSPGRVEIETVASNANSALVATVAVSRAQAEIHKRLRRMTGPRFEQTSALKFADPRFERIVAAIRALAGEHAPLELSENGLGYNNLLYMATLLAALGNQAEDDGTQLLLVEEPEAHLHPQLQDLLLRYLSEEAGVHTQVVVSTHSPNFAAAAGVERMTILTRQVAMPRPRASSPARFDLEPLALDHLRRFLDVTKAGLLFARGVLMVEGLAEQLVMPQLARRLGISLSESGVSVVNVGGLCFAPFAALFSSERVPCRCAIVTDADPRETEADLEGGEELLSASAAKIKSLETDTMHVFLSQRTFEWDLVDAGNWEPMLAALERLKPRVAARLRVQDLASSRERADAMLDAVANVKGRFAQSLAQVLDDNTVFVVPDYLKQALYWAAAREDA